MTEQENGIVVLAPDGAVMGGGKGLPRTSDGITL